MGDRIERPSPYVGAFPYFPPCSITTTGDGPGPAGLRMYAGIATPPTPRNSVVRPVEPSGSFSQSSSAAGAAVAMPASRATARRFLMDMSCSWDDVLGRSEGVGGDDLALVARAERPDR